MGFDLGGAGPALRTSMSCVGAARCEISCFDEAKALRTVINNNLDDMHRPSLPYKFKFKFSGCGNDCVNAIQRSDMATIGTWRDNIRVNEEHGPGLLQGPRHERPGQRRDQQVPDQGHHPGFQRKFKASEHVSAANLGDGNTAVTSTTTNCVRCMHCMNVIPGGLLPGNDKGVTILVGGKGVLKIGATMGTVVIPFMKLESDEDFEKLNDLARNILDFFAENALEHERTGEMIERIGLVNFLEGLDIAGRSQHDRASAYQSLLPFDDWDEEVEKWNEYKQVRRLSSLTDGLGSGCGSAQLTQLEINTWQNYVRLSNAAHRIRCPTCTR